MVAVMTMVLVFSKRGIREQELMEEPPWIMGIGISVKGIVNMDCKELVRKFEMYRQEYFTILSTKIQNRKRPPDHMTLGTKEFCHHRKSENMTA